MCTEEIPGMRREKATDIFDTFLTLPPKLKLNLLMFD